MASGTTDMTSLSMTSQSTISTSANILLDDDIIYFDNVANANDTCEPNQVYYNIVFYPLILITFTINLTLFAAAAIDRKKLQRQTYLFASVESALISNVIYLLFFVWILADNYTEVPLQRAWGSSSKKMVWVFQEAATLAVPFCICWNIVTLILVTVNSATYVGRVANPESNEDPLMLKTPAMARLSIAISWIVPVFLIIIAMTKMNCVAECWCPSTNFLGQLCPYDIGCSHFWAPITHGFLYVCITLWFVAMIVACLLVSFSIWKYQRTVQPNDSKRKTSPGEMGPAEPIAEAEFIPEHDGHHAIVSSQKPRNKVQRKETKRPLRHRMNSRLRFALTLTIVFIVCCFMFVTAIILDTVTTEVPHALIFALSRLMMYIYTTVSPIIMIVHLPVLKSSIIKLFQALSSCCKSRTQSDRDQTSHL